ncbi:MAG TPA: LacI family DNA-binding transcriptional regulator [Chthonomonadaceae bacterium]|nr:LacI family DNA-binding transcriptional regulator [Chthonomonadaceae bacterium]
MRKRPTLADVALAAGVSKTTASLALNGNNRIPPATRERVLAAAETLQFRPHAVARALVRRRAEVLGIVCAVQPFAKMAPHAFEHALLSAIFYHALERGYNPQIYGFPDQDAGIEEFLRYSDGRSDAFLLINPPNRSALVEYLQSVGIPAITVLSRDSGPHARWVDSDNEGGIYAAIAHLAGLGHRHIAYLTGRSDEPIVLARVAAFRKALQAHGLPVREDWIQPYTWNADATAAQLDQWLAADTPPTALLTWYDFAAEDVYQAARERGLRIPEDLSVVGFDDAPSARTMLPSLTTVRQDPDCLGKAAVEFALETLCAVPDAKMPSGVICPVELIIRQSTAPPVSFGSNLAV